MDMYQKRKMMSENKKNSVENNNEKSLSKVVINWVMLFYGNSLKSIEISNFL